MQRADRAPTSTGKAPTMASKCKVKARGTVLQQMCLDQHNEWHDAEHDAVELEPWSTHYV